MKKLTRPKRANHGKRANKHRNNHRRPRSLADFQKHQWNVYGVQNDQYFEVMEMISRMNQYLGSVMKAVRQNDRKHLPYYLSTGFFWLLALANRLHINLQDEAWKRFPGVCPYCGEVPCKKSAGKICKKHADDRLEKLRAKGRRPKAILGFQRMFQYIYPHNTLEISAMHLLEEGIEVGHAYENFRGRRIRMMLEKTVMEMVDVFANICAVANCADINLSIEALKIFGKGCPKCSERHCQCRFRTRKNL